MSALIKVDLSATGAFDGAHLTPLRLDATNVASTDPARAAIALVDSVSQADFGVMAPRITATGAAHSPR